jgi:hypothetical protein
MREVRRDVDIRTGTECTDADEVLSNDVEYFVWEDGSGRHCESVMR